MLRPIRRALLSVSDKHGLIELAQSLTAFQVELVSTGGTQRALKEAGLAVREISEVTRFPEILDGRVKTLHPAVYAGILARRDDQGHQQTLQINGLLPIDLVVCNLYPFEQVLARGDRSDAELIENIDIGGPTMLRAAAKNFQDVAVLSDPGQYAAVSAELKQHQGALTLDTRRRLAGAAIARTADYDRIIADYFAKSASATGNQAGSGPLPGSLSLHWPRQGEPLRYGENPHQAAAIYRDPAHPTGGIVRGEQLHGKELSYNNWLDLNSAWALAREFSEPAAVIIKHNNPCGAATAANLATAFERAYAGDPVSAFGGIVALNRPVDPATAETIKTGNRFVECIIAPDYQPDALEALRGWKDGLRLLRCPEIAPSSAADQAALDFRCIAGGLLVQTRDQLPEDPASWECLTQRSATPEERAALWLAWRVCKHVKSNAIVLARDSEIVGVGAGQMSRVDAVQLAIRKAGDRAKGSVLASDAFFPFRDNVDAAAAAGITAIVQPGGSRRDTDSIDACNEHQIAMLFTGVRHFRH